MTNILNNKIRIKHHITIYDKYFIVDIYVEITILLI